MNLKEQLVADMKSAMKAGEKTRLSVIRLLRADIDKLEIAKKRELTEDELLSVLTSGVKKRNDAIELYNKGGRDELAQKERDEKAIIESYLPKQLSQDELKAIIDDAVAEIGDVNPKQMGAVMKIVMGKTKGRADGKVVSQMVRDALQG